MTARAIWDDIVANGWSTVETWVRDQATESLYLEFKSGASKKKDVESALSRAVSGFANADGGVLVFGIDARRDSDGIDCVQGVEKVADVRALRSRLGELIRDAAIPEVPNIAVSDPIVETVGDADGVVAVYVPASDSGPHRVVRGSKSNHYLLRTETGFTIMSHNVLAAMFGRRPPAVLRVHATHQQHVGGAAGSPYATEVMLTLHNVGRGSARDVLLRFEFVNSDGALLTPDPAFNWVAPSGKGFQWKATAPKNGAVRVWTERTLFPHDELEGLFVRMVHGVSQLGCRIRGRLDCEGAQPVRFDHEIPTVGEDFVLGGDDGA